MARSGEQTEGHAAGMSLLFSLSKNFCEGESTRVLAGEREGGGSPPRAGSNALNTLRYRAFGERSEDFSAAVRRKSDGIFEGCPGPLSHTPIVLLDLEAVERPG